MVGSGAFGLPSCSRCLIRLFDGQWTSWKLAGIDVGDGNAARGAPTLVRLLTSINVAGQRVVVAMRKRLAVRDAMIKRYNGSWKQAREIELANGPNSDRGTK